MKAARLLSKCFPDSVIKPGSSWVVAALAGTMFPSSCRVWTVWDFSWEGEVNMSWWFQKSSQCSRISEQCSFSRTFCFGPYPKSHRATNLGVWVNNLCALNYLFLVADQLRDKVGMANLEMRSCISMRAYHCAHICTYIYICDVLNIYIKKWFKSKLDHLKLFFWMDHPIAWGPLVGTPLHVPPFPFFAAKVQRCHLKIFPPERPDDQSQQGPMNPEGQAAKGIIATEGSNWKEKVVETCSIIL